jgi:membrane-associated phospholipid phosphatase
MRIWLFTLLVCHVCTNLYGQTPAPSVPSPPSPFQFSWPREVALLTTGIAAQALGQYRVKTMEPAGPEDLRRADLSPLDRWAAGAYSPAADFASDVVAIGMGGAMVGADVWHHAFGTGSRQPVLEDALILAQAFAWNSAINLNVRAERVHPRPFVYGTRAPAADRREGQAAGSFYSGHASAAFLGAVYLSTVYPLRHPEFEQRGWLWAGSLTVATTASALRVAAGKHFPSDVIAGAALGSLVGLGFIQLHLKDAELWGWNAAPWITTDGQPGLVAVRRL